MTKNLPSALRFLNLLNEGRRSHALPEISYGSFYPALKKLERENLVESNWGSDSDRTSSGARRKYFRLNGLGATTFEANRNYQMWVGDRVGQLQPEGC